MNYYIADLHFDHTNIIRLCDRPFPDVVAMNLALMDALRVAEARGASLYILGDVAFNLARFVDRYGWLDHPERHTVIVGNHDRARKYAEVYARCFGRVVGTEKTFRLNTFELTDTVDGVPVRLLLSHYPQQDLAGADLNLAGHHHNNMVRYPDRFVEQFQWLLDSRRHINVGVEVLDYRPKTLGELLTPEQRTLLLQPGLG